MATKKKADVPQNILSLMHPDLPFDDKSLEDRVTKGDKNQTQQTDYSAQMATMQETLKRLEESNATLQRTNMALMGQPITPQPQNFGPQTVDLEGLPDPVTDPKAYAQAIVQRGDAVLQARQRQQQWQSQQEADLTARVDDIWDQFGKAYPGLKGKDKAIEAAATEAVAKARRSGIDPNKYMFAATPQFFADTVNVLKEWGIEAKAGEEEQTVEEVPALRTSGIPGGIEGGSRMTTPKDPDEERIPSLMEELRGWKEKTGFYA